MPKIPNNVQAEPDELIENPGDEELETIHVDKLAEARKDGGEVEDDDAVADLKRQLAEKDEQLTREREGRRVAEANRVKADNNAGAARTSQVQSQKQAILNRLDAAQTKLDSAKVQYKQALAAGDTDQAVELQDIMTSARYELNAADWEKKRFETWETSEAAKAEARIKNPELTEGTQEYTRPEQEWIDAHPQFYTDTKFARFTKVLAAEALEKKIRQDSPAFFRFIEEGLTEEGFSLSSNASKLNGARSNGKGNSTSTAAPVDRSGTTGGTPTIKPADAKYPFIPKGFNIPKEWVQAATDQGFDDVREYVNMRLEDEATTRGRQ